MKQNNIINENDYWYNQAIKLQDVACPKCGDTYALFQAYQSIGCRTCISYFGNEDFK